MIFPQIAPALPKRGNIFSKAFARLNFRLIGWRLEGEPPPISKCVLIGAPHKFLWDFWLCWLVWTGLGAHVHWIFNKKYERGIIRPLARWASGIPVDTTTRGNVVQQMADQFARREKFFIAIMPEGTRFPELQPIDKWKTGFYHIALRAEVPIVPILFDRIGKRVVIGPSIALSGNQELDFAHIQEFYTEPKGSNFG